VNVQHLRPIVGLLLRWRARIWRMGPEEISSEFVGRRGTVLPSTEASLVVPCFRWKATVIRRDRDDCERVAVVLMAMSHAIE
jgi:hypothetical protein